MIYVIGSGHCGTTLCMEQLETLEIKIGEVNSLREISTVNDINDTILKSMGITFWDHASLYLNISSIPTNTIVTMQEIIDDDKIQVIKDPRLSITLPYWIWHDNQAKIIWCTREIIATIQSYLARYPHKSFEELKQHVKAITFAAYQSYEAFNYIRLQLPYEGWYHPSKLNYEMLPLFVGIRPTQDIIRKMEDNVK